MARHHGAHLSGLTEARIPFTQERAPIGRLSTWTQPFLGVFVLIIAAVAALGVYSWGRNKASQLTGQHIPTLDQQMMAWTASQAG